MRYASALLAVVAAVFIWSAIEPYDRTTWWLEVFPVLAGAPILILTRKRFELTPLTYSLIAIHAIILMIGGHYTYARVPAGDWIRDAFGLARNHYDRLGHFAQGFVPAIIAREVLLRSSPLQRGGWLFFLVCSVCLAISAAYELLEWSAAVLSATGAEEFLATQGDIWDTQKDMALALIGAVCALLLCGRSHDGQLGRVAR